VEYDLQMLILHLLQYTGLFCFLSLCVDNIGKHYESSTCQACMRNGGNQEGCTGEESGMVEVLSGRWA
jgi:hypothetical protein